MDGIDDIAAKLAADLAATIEVYVAEAAAAGAGLIVVRGPLAFDGDEVTAHTAVMISRLVPPGGQFLFPSMEAYERWAESQ